MKSRIKDTLKRLAGQKAAHYEIVETNLLVRDWNYRRSRADYISVFRRRRLCADHDPAPNSIIIKLPFMHHSWSVYFIYAPDGKISEAHRFTISKLKMSTSKLFIIFASKTADLISSEVFDEADALIWKSLSGFDFSGYAIALRSLAEHSSGCRSLFMNDSVYGPFHDIDGLWELAKWELTGFTASANIENHIQSYAFMLRHINQGTVSALDEIFPCRSAFDSYEQVVLCQETRFARVASRKMSVGALWYGSYAITMDPSIYAAVSLIDADFPFLKKSLFTKHSGKIDRERVGAMLTRHSHP